MNPTIVYVIIGKDRQDKPRGFEKSTGRIYFNEIDAERDHTNPHFCVEECIIMSKSFYDENCVI